MPIKVLAPRLVSLIAAGEVVARPASVVKELLENALDAGATRISIVTEGGGIGLVRVTDNGSGIPPDEVELAFERHATSKIAGPADLDAIGSLGFRGEALASIAAAADVEITSATAAGEGGVTLKLEGGRVIDRQRQGRDAGTTITVRNLFRHIPARRKFLKSRATENGHIAAVVSRYALAFPEVGLTLSVEGRTSLRTPGSGQLADSLAQVYGPEVAAGMLPVKPLEGYQAALEVSGMVGAPQLGRGTRDYISLFVNRRWISHRSLAWAVEEAYHGLLMVGKHPIAVINLTVPPETVDVNVHPAKTEVKFRDERAVVQAVQRAVRQTLVEQAPVARMETVRPAGSPGVAAPTPFWAPPPQVALASPSSPSVANASTPTPAAALPVLRVVGQLLASYIVAEGPEGLYLIDQHAAHERIRFEEISGQHQRRAVESQALLEPVTIELNTRQAATLDEQAVLLGEFGFDIEPFGERTFLVRAVPAWVAGEDWRSYITELLDGDNGGDWRERIVASLACHGAVRAGQVLSQEEMRGLLRQLEGTNLPHCCPHGRPTMICLSRAQLEREFGRT